MALIFGQYSLPWLVTQGLLSLILFLHSSCEWFSILQYAQNLPLPELLAGCYCFVSLGKNFCFVYPSVAGSGCSCSWSSVVAPIIGVAGVAVA